MEPKQTPARHRRRPGAVDDGAAEVFALSFHTHMLKGETFGQAVRAAHEEIWVRFPSINTWRAYQCYGDPGYVLSSDGSESGVRNAKTYDTPAELVSELSNYGEWVRMRVREKGENGEELERLRGGIVAKLEGVSDKARSQWLARGDVAAALGFAWGETGAWTEAVEWLEKALSARMAIAQYGRLSSGPASG